MYSIAIVDDCAEDAAALAALWRYHAVAVKQFGGVTGDLAGWFLQRAELWMLAALLLSGRWLG